MAKALKHSSGLQLLALDENEISDAGIDVLKVCLAGQIRKIQTRLQQPTECCVAPLEERTR